MDAPMADAPAEAPSGQPETIVTIDIPTYKYDLYDLIKVKRLRVIQAAAQHSKTRPITEKHVQDLRALFVLLNNIDMTPELKKATLIDKGLDVIMNTTLFHFPAEFQEMAKNLKEYWEAQNWGAGEIVKEEDDGSEDEADGSNANPPGAPPHQAEEHTTLERVPPRNHPIYGENGIMHDIFIKRGRTTSYYLNPRARRIAASVFGNNGIQLGTCWPLQMAALRDGAHGSKMGGIHGRVNDGAFSIVVSGMYGDLDQDNGTVLFYSGSDSHNNEDPTNPKVTSATKALQTSLQNRKPVRVIRNSSGHSQFAPRAGLRYDGLYEVKSEARRRNAKGGAYLQFRLERCPGQPAIALDRPTREERNLFEHVRAGY